jgi:dipeptidyl aminopeptidase/acylaminoacyl peptidase
VRRPRPETRRRGAATVAITVLAAAASPAPAAERDHDVTLEDYFTQSYLAAMAMAPDGGRIAYVEGRWDEGLDRRNLDLWTVDVESGRITRLTFDPAADTKPRWSADGKWIYFLSKRADADADAATWTGERQVWRVPSGGGSVFPVTREKEGVKDYELSESGETLYYVVGHDHVEPDPWKTLREEFDDLEYGHGAVTFGRLWALDLRTWRARRLVDERRVIGAFAVSPDERRIAMITTPTEELITNEGWSHVDVYDAATKTVTRLADRLWRTEAPSPYGWIVNPAWSSDSTKLAFRVDFDGYPGEVLVAHFADDAVRVDRLRRPNEVSVEGAMAWWPGRHDLCFVADDHARSRLHRVADIEPGRQGAADVLTPGDVVVSGFGHARDGAVLAVIQGGPTYPPDLFVVRDPGPRARSTRVTHLNPQVDTWKIPQTRIVRWTSPDGTPVEGILELPPDYAPGDGPLPTLVTVHGGPTASSKIAFRYWMYGRTLMPARGWAVLDPNYRGSTGYGDAFLTDLIENKNNLDVQDILAGVDMLVREGIADPDRLAVGGWSNGGYLTNCLIAATPRFKAASSGAGVFDTVMQWSIEDTPGHVVNYSGGLPWERGAKMHDTSPLYDVDKVVTPTLIHVGEKDERVPVEHSRALHRALHHYLGVPCELVVYPGAGHGLTTYTHRKAKLTWDLKWIEHHVLGRSTADEPDETPGEP